MKKRRELTRRDFLRLSAAAAGGTILGPSVLLRAAPHAVQMAYNEAPMLQALVESGALPPVQERLPLNPMVIQHEWSQIGNYGGVMHWSTANPWGLLHFVQESLYGNSPIRWDRDGLDIIGGYAESWEINDDITEITIHYREGLKWSDGQPWTTADVMYWWNDMVLNPDHPEIPPESLRSGTGTAATVEALDDFTIRIIYDITSPVALDKIASWVKWIFANYWSVPSHYLRQFHPAYSDAADFEEHDRKLDMKTNPELPVLTGWRLSIYEEGVRQVWERNPYYYCVDAEGNQLPYIDTLIMDSYQNDELDKLAYTEGQNDFGFFHSFSLTDIAALQASQDRSQTEVRFWDSGTGTGSMFFVNYDFGEEVVRNLFRDSNFRRALSHAFNREQARQILYLGFGELTTGTISPKAIEFNFDPEGLVRFNEWRDSAIVYDPDLARSLLDELGMVDVDGDGWRELPDGEKFELPISHGASVPSEHSTKNELLAQDLQAVGINAYANPVPDDQFDPDWRSGKQMTYSHGEASDGPNLLLFTDMTVPSYGWFWAPLEGQYYLTRGTDLETSEQDVSPWDRNPPRLEPEPGGPVARLQALLDQALQEPDNVTRYHLVWDMVKIHVEDGPFLMGVVYNLPSIILVKEGLNNVPTHDDLALGGFTNPWQIPTPAVYDPEHWFFTNPDEHST